MCSDISGLRGKKQSLEGWKSSLMEVDRIDKKTSWPCYKSNAMFDNFGKRSYDFLALGTIQSGLRIILIGTINSIMGLGGKNCE
jgi:hypothetical protein